MNDIQHTRFLRTGGVSRLRDRLFTIANLNKLLLFLRNSIPGIHGPKSIGPGILEPSYSRTITDQSVRWALIALIAQPWPSKTYAYRLMMNFWVLTGREVIHKRILFIIMSRMFSFYSDHGIKAIISDCFQNGIKINQLDIPL